MRLCGGAVQPAIRSQKLGKHTPDVAGAFISSSGSVIGQVKIGVNSSVGYGTVIRGMWGRW